MDKYTKSLNHVKIEREFRHLSYSKLTTMQLYLKRLTNLKKDMMSTLDINISMVCVKDDRKLYECLISLACCSVAILQIITRTSIETIMLNNKNLFQKKNKDYGNSFEDFSVIGIIVRLNDKINRIINLANASSEEIQVDEKVEDTINDLYNYCLIGLMYK